MLSAFILSELGSSTLLLAEQWIHQRFVRLGPLVLESASCKHPTPVPDRDRTVSRRSEPNSRAAFIFGQQQTPCLLSLPTHAALMGEQPTPWDLLQPRDATSRHRGAKPPRRCERLGEISLLSPEYLLSIEQRQFHASPRDH